MCTCTLGRGQRPKGQACARQENGQERDHCLYCLCCGLLAQACHATSCTAPTSHLWTLPVGRAQYCTMSSHLSAPDTLSDHRGTLTGENSALWRQGRAPTAPTSVALPINRARERTAPGLRPLACASRGSGRSQRAPAAPQRRTQGSSGASASHRRATSSIHKVVFAIATT